MAITTNLFVRVNTDDARRAIVWYEKGDGVHAAANLAAFTAALGGTAANRADVEVRAADLMEYVSVAVLRAISNRDPGISVSAQGVLSVYTPPARVTREVRRAELQYELARSIASLGHLEAWNEDTLTRVQDIAVRCYYVQLLDSVVDSETTFGKVLDTAKIADKRLLAYYPALTAANVEAMQLTYRSHDAWYAETAPKTPNARRFYPITRSGETYTVENLITFASAPAAPADAISGDAGRPATAKRDCARWLSEVEL